MNWIWVDGGLHPVRRPVKGALSPLDRGLLYGDGLFETLRIENGRPLFWDEHFERLAKSAGRIVLLLPSRRSLGAALAKTLAANRMERGLARLTVTRGSGTASNAPALAPPKRSQPSLIVTLRRRTFSEEAMRATICRTRREGTYGLKSTNLIWAVLAQAEAEEKGADEGIVLSHDGRIVEGTITNIFFVRKGVIKTPSEACGIVPGITRRLVIDLCAKMGLRVEEGTFSPSDLLSSNEAFLTGTGVGVRPLIRVDQKKIGRGESGAITNLLAKEYERLVKREAEE